MESLNSSIKHNTWLIILVAVAFSFVFPSAGTHLKPYLNYLLMSMMFLSCLDLKIPEIIKSLGDVKNISLMLLIVHLVSPLIIFLLRGYFSPQVFLGLIITATIPAGRSAVFLSNIYGGVPIKALVSTSLSNLFSPITVPLFVWIFAHTTIKMNPAEMSQTILKLVVIPLIFAVFFGRSKFGQKLNQYSPSISVFILFFIILGIISPLKSIVSDNLQLSLVLSIIITILIIIDFCLGYLLGKNHSENITYAISSSYKNYTLATLLSLTVFTPLVALPSIVYTVVSNLLLVPLQLILQPPKKANPHRHHKNRNLLLLIVGIASAIMLAQSPYIDTLINSLNKFPLLAAFIGGLLFTSTFTVATGAIILVKLAGLHSPLLLIPAAGLGAVSFDLLIFSLFKDKAPHHVAPAYSHFVNQSHLRKILHTHYFAWTLPVIGAFIMASPLPDELAVSLLGISKINSARFILVAFVSHIIGMTTIITGAKLF